MDHIKSTRAKWLTKRSALLAREKEFNHARDALSAARRDLPFPMSWLKRHDEYT